MSRQVFSRVICGKMELDDDVNVELSQGVIEGYERHALKGLDYPAVIPQPGSQVRGVIGYNITDEQVKKLDIFEGDEYAREKVQAWDEHKQKHVTVNAYVWTGDKSVLLDQDWNFDQFVQTKMANWISEEMKQTEGIGNRFWNPSEVEKIRNTA